MVLGRGLSLAGPRAPLSWPLWGRTVTCGGDAARSGRRGSQEHVEEEARGRS